MTDKKFTQKEVINGLECCTKDDAKYCPICSYYDEEGEHEQLCVYRLHEDALDLINRLKTRIVRYQLKNTNQRKGLASLNKKVAEQKVEIDILIRKKETLRDEIAEQQAEIERLKELLKSSGEYINNLEKEMTEDK